MMSMARTQQATRQYHTAIRRGEARNTILDAAAELFAERGYLSTSIHDIAVAARVARATVFAAVGNKPTVFHAVLDAAVEGDAPGVPLADQAWLRDTTAETDPQRILARHAHNVRQVGERTSDLYWAAHSAAEIDADVREVFTAIEAGRRFVGRTVCTAIAERGGLRHELDAATAADVLDAVVSPGTWRALVDNANWSPDRWEHWAAESSAAMLLDSPG